jgi:hypothetical protein
MHVAPPVIEVRDARLEELLDPAIEFEVLADALDFAEGPAWREPDGYLLFSDVAMDVIYRWDAAAGVTECRRPSRKSNGLGYDGLGRLLACEHASSTVTRTERDRTVAPIAERWSGRALNSPTTSPLRAAAPCTSPIRPTAVCPSGGGSCGRVRSTSRGCTLRCRAGPRRRCSPPISASPMGPSLGDLRLTAARAESLRDGGGDSSHGRAARARTAAAATARCCRP